MITKLLSSEKVHIFFTKMNLIKMGWYEIVQLWFHSCLLINSQHIQRTIFFVRFCVFFQRYTSRFLPQEEHARNILAPGQGAKFERFKQTNLVDETRIHLKCIKHSLSMITEITSLKAIALCNVQLARAKYQKLHKQNIFLFLLIQLQDMRVLKYH